MLWKGKEQSPPGPLEGVIPALSWGSTPLTARHCHAGRRCAHSQRRVRSWAQGNTECRVGVGVAAESAAWGTGRPGSVRAQAGGPFALAARQEPSAASAAVSSASSIANHMVFLSRAVSPPGAGRDPTDYLAVLSSRGGQPQKTLPSRNAAALRHAVISLPLASWRYAHVSLRNASVSSAIRTSARSTASRAITCPAH